MLQVKDPQEVFDALIKAPMDKSAKEAGHELQEALLNSSYSCFVLGEMYGTISTCLAQNIPIPKELWDMPVVKSFVRGDVDDVFYADKIDDKGHPSKELYTYTNSPIVDHVVVVDEPEEQTNFSEEEIERRSEELSSKLRDSGFNPTTWT